MNIKSNIEQLILSKLKPNTIFAEYYKRTSNKATYKPQATNYEAKEIKDWKRAIMAATEPTDPRRGELMRFYQSLRLDNHLASVIDTRILRVQRSSFKIVNEKGEENEELKALLERPWYEDLVRLILLKNFQGTTLIEMFDTDANGELESVTEIPQANFIATKGIVINEEWDSTGVSYKEGRLSDYYVQIGNNYELGMLNELAMIILAKKLGLGSWMSYIQKFGVPPVFVVTERMDKTRLSELFNMLSDFRSNHFAVLQGNEKVEMPNNNNLDGYKSFQALNEFADAQISKRVLGGTATTDEKSFTGSAEVQERVATQRNEADKLLFKYYFNTHIRQRLTKISSVYADFATHTLEWDNQETLSIEDYIDGVQKLASVFDFDIDEIKTRTGLPIIGVKQSTPRAVTEQSRSEKKKPKPSAIGLQYAPFNISVSERSRTANAFIYAATWDNAIERLANQIYNGEVKPQDLDRDLVLKNYAAFNKAAQAGYGSEYYKADKGRTIRENLLKYAGAKSYNLMQQLEALKADSKDKSDFTTKAKKLVNLHNATYLDTEKQFVSRSAAVAREWQQFEDDKDIYPNLMFRTMMDDIVRDEHQKLDGIVKAVDDPFWNTHTPPLGHRCRCTVEQTLSPATDKENTPKIKVAKEFAHTPKNGEIFTKENPYTKSVTKTDNEEVKRETERIKEYIPYSRSIKVGKHKIFVNNFHDQSDYEDNVKRAKLLIKELEKDIYIRPHFEGVAKWKSPEYGIGSHSKKGDLKVLPKETIGNFFNNQIGKASKQNCEYVVMDISKYKGDSKDLCTPLRDGLFFRNGDEKNKKVKTVIIIHDTDIIKITRKQVKRNLFNELITLKEKR